MQLHITAACTRASVHTASCAAALLRLRHGAGLACSTAPRRFARQAELESGGKERRIGRRTPESVIHTAGPGPTARSPSPRRAVSPVVGEGGTMRRRDV
ncbi:hypothetical protein DICSQDRAFT_152320 [Dichomitus squalens LYAD-421 SS1]|uniref:uncharacterized protein n=1 Tax=Dichomitus squalens (strain LYAD-421) TaxID=732165 RepID=UPI00044138AD|nr:uncharacterized protein DICSQDRAFT_152320 [Dichomitus squalens LYAD-421 SS1]EJF65005.1 hypothetical protein DICSQDRAFT_152320 [Dichomitus squalens LYAD-421 SS1]